MKSKVAHFGQLKPVESFQHLARHFRLTDEASFTILCLALGFGFWRMAVVFVQQSTLMSRESAEEVAHLVVELLGELGALLALAPTGADCDEQEKRVLQDLKHITGISDAFSITFCLLTTEVTSSRCCLSVESPLGVTSIRRRIPSMIEMREFAHSNRPALAAKEAQETCSPAERKAQTRNRTQHDGAAPAEPLSEVGEVTKPSRELPERRLARMK